MNNKGAFGLAMAAVLVVAAVVGIGVVDDITCKFCQCDDADAINDTLYSGEWVNNTCDGEKCDTLYYVYCNSTLLEAGTDYNIDECNIYLTNATWNNTNCMLEYDIEGSYYHGNDVTGIVMCNIPVIMAALALALGAGWLFWKGGL